MNIADFEFSGRAKEARRDAAWVGTCDRSIHHGLHSQASIRICSGFAPRVRRSALNAAIINGGPAR